VQDLLFRALVRLLPEEFRAGYARDMEATFRAERREAGGAPETTALVRLWLATGWDVARAAFAQHAEILARDTRYALRTMAARKAHTLAALVTLALGIGANVAMFAVLDGVLLAPLPYRDPAGLVAIQETSQGEAGNVGYLSFVDLRARARTLTTLAAAGQSTATLLGDGRGAERVNAMRVSRAYFDMLGVRPALGRAFSEGEDQPGAARRVAILSDRLWRDRYAADPRVIGRPIDVAGIAHQVVGVLPRDFEDLVAARMYEGAELWFPLGYDPAASFACRTCRHLRVFGRLAPAAGASDAQRELAAIFGALEAEHPTEYHAAGAAVTPLAEVFLGPVRPALLVLWAGVLALLLVACSNVANLLLLRASERSYEVAVRTALGVTRGRLTRQLLTESLLLALVGGLLGTLLAWVAVRVLVASGPAQLPRLTDVQLDTRAVAAAFVLSLLSAALFGLVPLRQLVGRPSRSLAGAGRRTASQATWRIRSFLVAGNVAMASLLLVGSGLLVRSLAGLLAIAPGLDPVGVLTMQIWLGGEAYRRGEDRDQIAAATRFYDELLTRVRALPGVTAASAVTTLPLGGGVDGYGLHIAGRAYANPEQAPSGDRFVVTPQFFATLRIPLLRGRLLDAGDAQDQEPVVVINRTLAESLFPRQEPLGQQLSLGPPSAPRRRIVGIVGDVRHHGLHLPVGYQVYVPQAQWAWAETFMTLVVRAEGDPVGSAKPVRDIVRALDPAQPVTRVRRYEEVVSASLGTRRFATALLSAFALVALLMALVGLYGALGVYVGQRRLEIGVRLALGAPGPAIRRMVLGQGMRPAVAGLVLGLLAAAVSVGLLRTLLHEVRALDPGTFVTTAALLLAATVAACFVPAWRASRIDPAATLRTE
jgi:putative ABC transport system permease protein